MPYQYTRINVPDFLVLAVRKVLAEGIHSAPPHFFDEFWDRLQRIGDCWIDQGATDRDGYGQIEFGGTSYKAHRFAFMLANGPIPDGLQVLHNCPDGDNPRCCNPAHLWLGTQADNMRDMARKGRARRGEARSYLTNEMVLEIRARYAAGGVTTEQLGKCFGLSKSSISRIVRREYWKHI